MIPNPIHKVLLTLHSHDVRFLLVGGQACILYGAAEFSRDTDIIILAASGNIQRLTSALDELRAECIAVPPFSLHYLLRGHAIHFRSHHPEAEGMRIDVMTKMRGVAPFDELWTRRTTVQIGSDLTCHVVSIQDLIRTKKTQRDKDWPMIRRLIEAHYVQHRTVGAAEHVPFWLREARTVPLLFQLAEEYPDILTAIAEERPLLDYAREGNEAALESALAEEEQQERARDRQYWLPLRKELEILRHKTREERRNPFD